MIGQFVLVSNPINHKGRFRGLLVRIHIAEVFSTRGLKRGLVRVG